MIDKIETVNSWDEYYYGICVVVARNSKCFSRQIGSILVKDKSIISTGYNGPPRGIPRCDKRHLVDDDLFDLYKSRGIKSKELVGRCPRQVLGFKSGEGLEWCIAGHSERNVLINAARHGISTKGAIIYMTCSVPCSSCLVEIINAGVKEIVVTGFEFYDVSAKYLLDNSDLKIRKFDFLEKNEEKTE